MKIDRQELHGLLDAGAQLVEVLAREEYEAEHIPGAISLPLYDIDARSAAALLDSSRTVVTYCQDWL